jgi:predicted kinase
LVRAKVAALRLAQPEVSRAEQSALQHDLAAYLELALASIEPPQPTLVLMHGVSGSGKSHLAARLAQRLGWLHIRSDVERKRLFGLWGGDAQAHFSGDLYRQEVSEYLFAVVLPQIAQAALTGGLSLLLDATFLQRRERQRFHGLAVRLGVRFVLLDCRCPLELAERRILQRQAIGADPSDADFAVLQRQLASREPLAQEERASVLAIAMGSDEQGPLEQEAWNARVEQLVIALG